MKIVDKDDVPDASVVGDVRLALVDQTAVYVTGVDPIADPSVYVVTAFHDSVSACAEVAQIKMPDRRMIGRMTVLIFMISSLSRFSYLITVPLGWTATKAKASARARTALWNKPNSPLPPWL